MGNYNESRCMAVFFLPFENGDMTEKKCLTVVRSDEFKGWSAQRSAVLFYIRGIFERCLFVCLFVSSGIPIRVSSELIFSHRRLIWFLNKSSFHKNGVEFG